MLTSSHLTGHVQYVCELALHVHYDCGDELKLVV